MDEPLSDLARDLLAFIRDHPGHDYAGIAKMLAIDDAIVRNALGELVRRRLVVRHMKGSELVSAKIKGPAAYYPA